MNERPRHPTAVDVLCRIADRLEANRRRRGEPWRRVTLHQPQDRRFVQLLELMQAPAHRNRIGGTVDDE